MTSLLINLALAKGESAYGLPTHIPAHAHTHAHAHTDGNCVRNQQALFRTLWDHGKGFRHGKSVTLGMAELLSLSIFNTLVQSEISQQLLDGLPLNLVQTLVVQRGLFNEMPCPK